MSITTADLPIDAIRDWLVDQALNDVDARDLVRGLCRQLRDAGIPIDRVRIGGRVLHPQLAWVALVWEQDRPLAVEGHSGTVFQGKAWLESPFRFMADANLEQARWHLTELFPNYPFPVLGELAEQGYTDYVAMRSGFAPDRDDRGFGLLAAFATRRPEGFSSADLAALDAIRPMLTVAFKVVSQRQLAVNVLTAYHGQDAGTRILGGQIRRGDGKLLRTAIWYSDLRDSTALAEQLEIEHYLRVINAYCDCTAGAILDHGGEVVEIVGDAVLGIFPVTEAGDGDAAARAIAAAREARARLAGLRADSCCIFERGIGFGVALHFGELIYGNVGTASRLSFGLRGMAVNEAARIEALTKMVGRPVLASDRFVALADGPWEPLGAFPLRGRSLPMAVSALHGAA